MDTIRVHLAGDPETMNVSDALQTLRQMVNVIISDTGATRWRPVSVAVSSLTIEVAPSTDDEETASLAVARARHRAELVDELTRGNNAAAAELGREDIGRIVRLGRRIGARTGITGISVVIGDSPDIEVTAATVLHGEQITEGQYESYGSVSGVLDLISARGERHVEISTDDDGPVRCELPGGLWQLALPYLGTEVDVEGVLHRNAFGQPTGIVAMTIAPRAPRPLPVPIADLIGALDVEWPPGVTSDGWVRGQRDA